MRASTHVRTETEWVSADVEGINLLRRTSPRTSGKSYPTCQATNEGWMKGCKHASTHAA